MNMKKMAMIRDGVVENIALWDGISTWIPGAVYTLVDVTDADCDIGYVYNQDGSFTPPESS